MEELAPLVGNSLEQYVGQDLVYCTRASLSWPIDTNLAFARESPELHEPRL